MLHYLKPICLAVVALASTARAEQTGLTLVSNGEARAVIVQAHPREDLPDRPSQVRMVQRATGPLVWSIKQITGAQLPVVQERDLADARIVDGRLISDSTPAEIYILLGAGDLTRRMGVDTDDLGPGGMLARTVGNALILAGPADSSGETGGAFYAVIELLESVGCRYLWPGALGMIMPRQPTLTVGPLDRRHDPPIRQRDIRFKVPRQYEQRMTEALGVTGVNVTERFQRITSISDGRDKDEIGWGRWSRLGGDMGIKGGHAFGKLWDEYGSQHPEWFALQPDGTRVQQSSSRARLCVSNTELIDHIAQRVVAEREEHPQRKSISLSPNDGGRDWFCTCENCLALDPPDAPAFVKKRPTAGVDHSLTDRYVWFWNQIADRVTKVHPDLLLTVDAYSVYQMPPVERKLHANLIVRFVSRFDNWDAWASKAGMIYWRPNILHAGSKHAMLEFHRAHAEQLKHAAHHGAVAVDIDSITHSWATRGLEYYVLSRLAWDPDLDVDGVIDDYCRAGFGDAADHIRLYFAKAEALTHERRQVGRSLDKAAVGIEDYIDALTLVYTPQALHELAGRLDAADAANDDAIITQRIAFLRIGLEFTDVQARAFRALRAYKLTGKLDEPAATIQLLDQRDALLRRIAADHPLAVNVAYLRGRSHGWFQPLRRDLDAWQRKQKAATDE